MPSCFQLTKKGESEASDLDAVDKELCDFFGWECDPVRYAYGWFDTIGFRLAVSNYNLGDYLMRSEILAIKIPELVAIHEYLFANYSSRNWVEVGKNRKL